MIDNSIYSWVFRAETHEEMLAWYHDIEQLMQLPHMSSSQRQTFIASHAPENVLDLQRPNGSLSPGLDEDEADEVPYSQTNSIEETTPQLPERPPPGGLFPSESQLDDFAMYGDSRRYSRAGSDITSDLHPPGTSREEEVALVFISHEIDRPYTGGTEGSTTDDREFSTTGFGASIGAAAAGGAIMASKHKDHDIHQELDRSTAAPSTGSHAATSFYTGTSMNQDEPSQLGSTNKQFSPSQSPRPLTAYTTDSHPGDALIGGATKASSLSRPRDHESETPSANVRGEGRPPVNEEVLPAELSRPPTASSLSAPVPTHTIRRSKSQKEIVEETIADSMGNHPERGVTPGAWPETPASEVQHDGIFR